MSVLDPVVRRKAGLCAGFQERHGGTRCVVVIHTNMLFVACIAAVGNVSCPHSSQVSYIQVVMINT